MLSVQFIACTVRSKGSYNNNQHRHSNTFSRPFGYSHSLDTHLQFTTAFNMKEYYSDTAPTTAVALGGISDEDLGDNSVRAA